MTPGVVELYQQAGALMAGHFFPVALGECAFYGPQQVQAGFQARILYGQVGGYGALLSELLGGVYAGCAQHLGRSGPQIEQLNAFGLGAHRAVVRAWLAWGHHRRAPGFQAMPLCFAPTFTMGRGQLPRFALTMKTFKRSVFRMLITGAVAALPLAATALLVGWLLSLLFKLLGPQSAVGSVLAALGVGVAGREWVGYVLGLATVGLGLVSLGALVEMGLQRSFARLLDRLLRSIPLVRTIWDLSRRVAGMLDARQDPEKKPMQPVWVSFGGPRAAQDQGAVVVLALLSSAQPVWVSGQACLAVLLPTAPVPVGGGLMFVPQHWVKPADVGAEALTSIYVSMGVTAPEYLPKPPRQPLPTAPEPAEPLG